MRLTPSLNRRAFTRSNRTKNRLRKQRRLRIHEELESRELLATNVLFGSVDQFTGPNDLTLDASKVVYAVDFSQNNADSVINGVTFQHDRQAIAGASFQGPNQVSPWQVTPNYGATADDDNLESVMADIRWANAGAAQKLEANLDVVAGTNYRVELLISGNHQESRNWDIRFEGQDAVDEMTSLGISGTAYNNGSSAVWRHDFTATDSQIQIEMGNFFGGNDGGDRNPIWQGLTLHTVNEDPVVNNLDGDLATHPSGNGRTVLDQAPTVTVTDDQASLDTGNLTVTIASGEGSDALGVSSVGGISTSGAGNTNGETVSFSGNAIGTITSVSPLVVTFNATGNATPAAAEALLAAVDFTDGFAATQPTRTVNFTLNDGSGGSDSADVDVVITGVGGAVTTYTWDGTGDGTTWSDTANYVGDPAVKPDANDIVIFTAVGAGPVDLGAATQFVGEIHLDAGGYNLANGTLNVLVQVDQSAGVNEISATIEGAVLEINVSGGELTISDDTNSLGPNNVVSISGGELIAILDVGGFALGDAAIDVGNGQLTVQGPAINPLGGVTNDLELWLDASDINGDGLPDTLANNDPVSTWNDKSGNGHHASVHVNQPVYNSAGPNGQPVVNFTNDVLKTTTNFQGILSDYTMITVARYTGGDNERIFSSINTNWLFGFWGNSTERWYADGWVYAGGANDTDWHLHSGNSANGPNSQFWKDGNLLHSGGGGTNGINRIPRELSIGGWNTSENSNSEVAEVLIYDRVITNVERLAVEDYLNDKYGFGGGGGGGTANTSLNNNVTVSGNGTIDVVDLASLEFNNLNVEASASLSVDSNTGVNLQFTGDTTIAGAGDGVRGAGDSQLNALNGTTITLGNVQSTAADVVVNDSGDGRVVLGTDSPGNQAAWFVGGGTMSLQDDGALGASSVTGVDAGTLEVNGATLPGSNVVLSGGTLVGVGTGGVAVVDLEADSNVESSGTLTIGSVNTIDDDPTGADAIPDGTAYDLTFIGGGDTTVSGTVGGGVTAGADDITVNGGGSVWLSGDNAHIGLTTVNGGSLVAAHDNALGAPGAQGSGSETVVSGGELRLTGGVTITGEDLVLTTVLNNDGNNTWNGPVILADDATIASDSGTLTVAGDVSMADFQLTVDGAGDVHVTGAISGTLPAAGDPLDLGGVTSELELWLDSADIDGDGNPDALADGVLINNWQDKSGNARNFDNTIGDPNYVLSGTHGQPTVNFDGNDALRMNAAHNPRAFIDGNGEYTLISVARYSGSDRERVIAARTGHNWLFGFHGGSTNRWYADGWVALDPGGNINDADWHLHSGLMNVNGDASDPAADFYRDGVLRVNDGRGSGNGFNNYVPDGLSLGGWNGLGEASTAEVSELIMYNRVLSLEELQSVEFYLGHKYGLDVPDVGAPVENTITKEGSGTLTLSGDNSYNGDTIVNSGTVVADGSATALGSVDSGTTVVDGGTLGLSGGANLAAEAVDVTGFGAAGRPGAIVNISGNNQVTGDLNITGTEIGIGSVSGTLTITSDVDLNLSDLVVDGDGDVIITGNVSGQATPGLPPSLGNLGEFSTGDYALDVGGSTNATIDVRIDNDGSDSWLLVGHGREGWQWNAAGEGGGPDTVNDNLGTPAAFAPNYFSTAVINDIIGDAGIDLTDVEIRLKRAANIAGTSYSETLWRPVSETDWRWNFDTAMTVDFEYKSSGGVAGGSVGVSNNRNTRDSEIGGNDGDRVFTWAWGGHGNQRGFSYGSAVAGVDNNNPTTFLWENGTENHAIPYTEVYIRQLSTSGTNSITKDGAGTLTLSGDNSYAGSTNVAEGVVVVTTATALGTSIHGTDGTVADGGTVVIQTTADTTIFESFTIGAGAPGQGGALVNAAGNNTVGGDVIVLGAAGVLGSTADSLTIDGIVDLADGDLTVNGAGDLVINGDITGNLAAGEIPTLGGVTDDLELWLDASDINGDDQPDTLANNDPVSTWVDKSGAGHNATVHTGQPLYNAAGPNGQPVVNFTNDVLATSTNFQGILSDYTIITVARYTGGDSERIFSSINTNWLFGFWGNRTERWYADGWVHQGEAGNTNWQLHSGMSANGPDSQFWKNGNLLKDGGGGTNGINRIPQRLSIGGWNTSEHSNSEVAEVLIYDRVLSDDERQNVEGYLGAKYGLATAGSGAFGSNSITMQGTGTATLTGNNTFSGDTNVNSGTLVAASDTALGTADSGTNVVDGATLGLQGDITLSDEWITLNGTGAAGQPGALVNISGGNTIDPSVTLVVPVTSTEFGIGSVAGTLTIQTDVDMANAQLTVDGDGDVTIDGNVVATGGVLVGLNTLSQAGAGDHTITAGGQTFDATIDFDGTNDWLLVGRGREGWSFSDGGAGSPSAVNDNLGTSAAFTPTYFSSGVINDLITEAGTDLTDVEIRLKRAANTGGTSYSETLWRPVSETDWRWNFDTPMTVDFEFASAGGVPGGSVGVSNNRNTRDSEIGGNDGDRVFTWAWGGHGNQRGFSYGNAVAGVDNNSPTSFLWESGTENHAIPYTEVYIRRESAGPPPPAADNNLMKIGNGTLRLSGDNTYADGTTVAGGTLLANNATGSATGTGDVQVDTGGTLGGNGTISGNIDVATGTIAPGDPVGTLSTANVTVAATGSFDVEIGGNTAGLWDTLAVTGGATLSGPTLNGSLTNGFTPTPGEVFVILSNDEFDPTGGGFAGLPEGSALDVTGGRFHITYIYDAGTGTEGNGNDVALIANRAPIAGQDGPMTTPEDVAINIAAPGVLGNDSDPDAADTLTASLVTGPANALSFTLNPDGSWDYVPVLHFSGADSFTYVATDGDLDSNQITVDITIVPVADAPAVTVGASTITVPENSVIPLNITSDLVDQDGSETLVTTLTGVPAIGTLSAGTEAAGVYTLTPADLVGLTLTMPDNLPADAPFTLTITATATEGANSDAASTVETIDITVNNVAPAASLSGTTSTVPNFAVPYVVNVSDVGPTDQAEGFDITIDWGDGTMDTFGPNAFGPINLDHSFADFGNFDVTLTATDKDGGQTVYVHNVQVDPVAIIGRELFIGGTDAVSDRIIIQPADLESVFVRYNSIRYGQFERTDFDLVRVFGGDGDDRVSVSGTCLAVSAELQEGRDSYFGGTCSDTVDGGEGRDIIQLGEGDNVADGGDGNDIITARSGNDIIRGGSGNDRIQPGAGDDIVYGDGGNDQIVGGGGSDLLVGGLGNDNLNGGSGQDVLIGGFGNDTIRSGAGDDLAIGGLGLDGIRGDGGADTITGAEAANEADEVALLTLLTDWTATRDRTAIGSFLDDGDRDGLNGNGGADQIGIGINDAVNSLRSADTLFSV